LLIEQMVSRLDSSAFVLLLGDFNSQSHDAPYRYLSSRGWLDARHQATQIKGPVGTFPDFDGRRPDKRIDFIWYRNLPQPWQYLADGAPERTYPLVSDHLPIYAFFGN
jgi:endonuclease/exonuclease/phosphatase family metal-dependent hydrolase